MSDNIPVRWESEDGWREGVLCCVDIGLCFITRDHMLRILGESRKHPDVYEGDKMKRAIIWDRHRNERCIVPLSQVRLVPPRCQKCDGEGVVDAVAVTGNGQGAAYRCKTTCECRNP